MSCGVNILKRDKIKIKGVLIPKSWDEDGRVLTVQIASSSEKNYDLEFVTLKSKELLKHLTKEIEVIGVLNQYGDGTQVVKVSSYKLLKSDDIGTTKKKVEQFFKQKQ